MAPLIDVVFLLLTFFVFAMLMMVRAQVVDISLPEFGAGAAAEDVAAVTITLDASGGVFLDGEPIERDRLIDALRQRLESLPDARIYLAADVASASGDLLAVIDLLSRSGFGDVQLFGTPETSAPPASGVEASPGG